MKRQGFGFAGLRHYAQDVQKTGKFGGMKKMQEKGLAPFRRSGKARRNRTFVHIEKGVKMMQ